MNKLFGRQFLGSAMAIISIAAFGQHGGSHGGGGGGGGHSSGGGYSGGGGHSFSGGYSGGSRNFAGGGYSGGRSYSGSRSFFGGRSYSSGHSYSEGSRYGGSSYSGHSSYSRTQGGSGHDFGSRSSGQSDFGSRGGSRAGSGNSFGSSSRYSNSRNIGVSDRSFSQGHSGLSRSGHGNYTGSNNGNTGRTATGNSIRVGSAPRGVIGPSNIGRVIGRGGDGWHGEHGGHGGFGYRGGYRYGYFGYGSFWLDSFFAFPFYCFDPFVAPCYVSPWYYYPCLPAYVAAPNVVIESYTPNPNWSGRDYDWSPESNAPVNSMLDDSVQDLVHSFENDDHKAIDRVTPHSGNVKIFVDGKYSYSLKANDFYDTYVDGIESTKIDRYEIISVRENNNDGTARVVAKHIYNDPWGKQTFVYHSYLLVKEGDEYVIREFGTSNKI